MICRSVLLALLGRPAARLPVVTIVATTSTMAAVAAVAAVAEYVHGDEGNRD